MLRTIRIAVMVPRRRRDTIIAPRRSMLSCSGLTWRLRPSLQGYLTDGEVVTAAGLSLEVIAVPGHSPGGDSLLLGEGRRHLHR
ncbi:MAG: MBL fold metallo-hydrolase [Marinilabiliales bacterium]|nr:MBL fold metallo-hydrolase [Marinilabiliales bacterium]